MATQGIARCTSRLEDSSRQACVLRCNSLFPAAAVLALWSITGGLPLEAKRMDDVVVMKGGDRFTGEVKKLEKGILYFKASYMLEPLQLDWARVERLGSWLPDGRWRLPSRAMAPKRSARRTWP